jgi:hypothetical protein
MRQPKNGQRPPLITMSTFAHFNEGDLILAYDIAHDTLGHGKFESLWHGPYIIQHYLTKGAYILDSLEGLSLKEPINGLYLKKFYA